MKTVIKKHNSTQCAVVNSEEIIINDVQSALDFIASVQYETSCNKIAINKAAIVEDFFDLSTRLAGEILQKFVQYQVKLAIIGDFSGYTSKALKDFIYESNKGSHVFFVADETQALELLTKPC